jgi:hypothetical protein
MLMLQNKLVELKAQLLLIRMNDFGMALKEAYQKVKESMIRSYASA